MKNRKQKAKSFPFRKSCCVLSLDYCIIVVLVPAPQKRNNRIGESPEKCVYDGQRDFLVVTDTNETKKQTHTHTHTHARTPMHPPTHTCTHSHVHPHTRTLAHPHARTEPCTPTHGLAHSHAHPPCTCAHSHAYPTHTCIHTHTHARAHTAINTHVHPHPHAHTHPTRTHPHAHMRAHSCMHTAMHTPPPRTHTHTHTPRCPPSQVRDGRSFKAEAEGQDAFAWSHVAPARVRLCVRATWPGVGWPPHMLRGPLWGPAGRVGGRTSAESFQ